MNQINEEIRIIAREEFSDEIEKVEQENIELKDKNAKSEKLINELKTESNESKKLINELKLKILK